MGRLTEASEKSGERGNPMAATESSNRWTELPVMDLVSYTNVADFTDRCNLQGADSGSIEKISSLAE